MASSYFFDDDFKAQVIAAGAKARLNTLRAGIPVFYRDHKSRQIVEHPDGRKFEIRYLAGEPGAENYQVLKELNETAD